MKKIFALFIRITILAVVAAPVSVIAAIDIKNSERA
jgi:hypothetical protein